MPLFGLKNVLVARKCRKKTTGRRRISHLNVLRIDLPQSEAFSNSSWVRVLRGKVDRARVTRKRMLGGEEGEARAERQVVSTVTKR